MTTRGRGDFSAAKNFVLEKAQGNWIAFLDADEYFPTEDAAKLLPLLEVLHDRKEIDFLRTGLSNLDIDGSVFSASVQDRIFRNDPSLRYENPVHEKLVRMDGEGLAGWDARKDLTIFHTGYAGAELRKKKGGATSKCSWKRSGGGLMMGLLGLSGKRLCHYGLRG